MSLRPFALVSLALTLTVGCGDPSSSDSGSFGLDLLVDKAVADQLGSFQVVVLPNGRQRDCTELQKTCLKQQVKQDEPLMLKGTKGGEKRALLFQANLSGTSGTTQDVSFEAPVGRDYALIIEALSKETPARFLGSSCNYLPEVNAGLNDKVLAAPMTLTTVDCDPTF
ncbi:hypothetical protein [Hyalangium versicolor]|uniref:hypothetical protein n=1 Tax=Hyalangium versicolor TaxID=2861190 RepID=UPI001CCDC90F|nr:hypothetical protein [Hyalangium versicolor]